MLLGEVLLHSVDTVEFRVGRGRYYSASKCTTFILLQNDHLVVEQHPRSVLISGSITSLMTWQHLDNTHLHLNQSRCQPGRGA